MQQLLMSVHLSSICAAELQRRSLIARMSRARSGSGGFWDGADPLVSAEYGGASALFPCH